MLYGDSSTINTNSCCLRQYDGIVNKITETSRLIFIKTITICLEIIKVNRHKKKKKKQGKIGHFARGGGRGVITSSRDLKNSFFFFLRIIL